MKKPVQLLVLAASLLISGCTSSPKKKNKSSSEESKQSSSQQVSSSSSSSLSSASKTTSSSGTTSSTRKTSSSNTSSSKTTSSVAPTSSTSTTSIPPEPGDVKIEGLLLSEPVIEAKIGTKTKTPLLNVEFAEGYSSDNVDYTLTWSLEDSTLGVVDQYGRITGSKKGKTKLIVESDVDHRIASTTVYVYESESDFVKSWKRLGNGDVIDAGDQIILAAPNQSKAANDDCTGMHLHTTTITLNSDKSQITDTGFAAKFIVGTDYKGRDGFNLEIPEREDGKYLACTNEKKVSFFDTPKASSNLWTIEYDSEQSCWDMRSATNIDGWMMYNVKNDWFAPYQSSEQDDMIVISIYRYTREFK